LDEVGQSEFKLQSWQAIQRRLAINRGRVLITTTPYDDSGWLKKVIYDPWNARRRAGQQHPEIDVIQFDSIANPAFSREEYERQRESMPAWQFNLYYRGQFERPPAAIYDCWDDLANTCPRFVIPDSWPRYLGLDFGGVHTAGVFIAQRRRPDTGETTDEFFAYREYPPETTGWMSRTAAEHVAGLLEGDPDPQEILGDLHNLYGDTHAVHVSLDEDGSARLDALIKGDTVREVLDYVEFDAEMLLGKLRTDVETAVREGRVDYEGAGRLLRFYEDGLHGYTYLEG
jgi:hypothetical protein